ncbi:hypothetical protein LEP1GSC060_0415 [Leptospira weilii serovar Ranarum str. ICFT]|uniref:Lipoprotein n=1 Tax=Leptospira weilii serovar Ranarum str. ICFT TaxID=1218598 RepID=N1WHE6_9LEPT|nr:hypothetical protein LEP1GSC060_0415 [Leptospira weilii serovar Ranarum str. ICFT]
MRRIDILILIVFICACNPKKEGAEDRLGILTLIGLAAVTAVNPSSGFTSARLEVVSEIQFPFYAPYSLAVDSSDNVYVSESADYTDTFGLYLYNYNRYPADPGNIGNRIRKFDSSGNYLGWIGMGGNDGTSRFHGANEPDVVLNGIEPGRFQKIRGMKFDSEGTLYVIDQNRIHRFAPNTQTFSGWAGHTCKTAACQNAQTLYTQKIAQENQITVDCEASLDWTKTDDQIEADLQNCLDASNMSTVNNERAAARDGIIANVSSGWNLNEPFNSWGLYSSTRLDSIDNASGLAIRNGQLWIGYYRHSYDIFYIAGTWGSDVQPSTRINAFDTNTGGNIGWLGGATRNGQTQKGFFQAPSLATGTRPLGTSYHTNSPGLFNAPRSLVWHNDLLYVADNTSDPVVSVFTSQGDLVKSQYHDSGAKPFAITVAPNGIIFTSNMYTGEIELFDPNFRKIGGWQAESPSDPNRWYPIAAADFAWDSKGFLYISTTTKNKVYKMRLIAE